MKRILIAGSSGFIGSNLVGKLQAEGHYVVGIDIEEPKYITPKHFFQFDLRKPFKYNYTFDEVYCLACLMGGVGYIMDEEKHGYDIAIGSTQIITSVIDYCVEQKVRKVFYSSSACVYNQDLQKEKYSSALKESDAIPAFPDLLYGWQKLYAEKMFMASGLDVRIARFHNIFGKWGTYDGGKEKAPAAICRKAAMAKDGDEIEIWGDGKQERSFLHIDECLEGVERLMNSNFKQPLNIGSDELVSINKLAEMIIEISGKKLTIKNVAGNVGVKRRNSDNTLCEKVLNWRPTEQLYVGLEKTFSWINEQINGNNFIQAVR
jgi:nucleoside-diphosphate-sugar epimerase